MKQDNAMFPASLRSRIILALVLIVTLTSSLFAAGVLLLKVKLEAVIFEDMVREQFGVLLERLDSGTYHANEAFPDWHFHFGADAAALPPTFHALTPGSHHSVRVEGRYYQVEKGSHGGSPAYLAYDITDWENQEHELLRLLLLGVAGVGALAVVMGWLASRSILAPVRALTARLTAIRPGDQGLRLAPDFQGSEIGHIAQAVDRYLARMDSFVERERSFTAAASHELRTPLSVMLGAVDVLEANAQTPASTRALARIRRACRDMQAFIEATLFLARESASAVHTDNPVDVAALLEGLLEDNRAKLRERGLRAELRCQARPQLNCPASLLQILAGNLLRNAIEHSQGGLIQLDLDASRLLISDPGEGIAAADLPRVFEAGFSTKAEGTGMGLNLVKRICDRFGWELRLESQSGQGTRALIAFHAPALPGAGQAADRVSAVELR